MKRQSQKSRIFSFLLKHKPRSFTSKQITSFLKISNTSTRGRLSELKKSGSIESEIKRIGILKRKRFVYFIKIAPFRRKITKGTVYCEVKGTKSKHAKEMWFAITYEDNKTDRFFEEFAEIDRVQKSFGCHMLEETFGYDDQKIINNPPFIYPEIRVESEI